MVAVVAVAVASRRRIPCAVLLLVLALLALLTLATSHHTVATRTHTRTRTRANDSPAYITGANIDAEFARLKASALRPRPRPHDSGSLAVDVSDPVGQDTWSCMIDANVTFPIVRAWRSGCEPDANAVTNIQTAYNAGFEAVDIYLFPAFECALSASDQVDQMLTPLINAGVTINRVWFDIESVGSHWNATDTTANVEWLQSGMTEASLNSLDVGIYTSERSWAQVMGNVDYFANTPLWYARYDGVPNFDDFVSFGGWTTPQMKQYVGDATICGIDVDLNWTP